MCKFATEEETEFAKTLTEARESESRSHGVIVNSFYELEPEYADHYRNVLNRKAWHIGPLSLCNRSLEQKAQRGKQGAISEDDCLKWLESKSPNSVLYVGFGSITEFPIEQLHALAIGLEASRQQFIWVVRTGANGKETEDWMREGF
ncbi:UDP-glycosyltransferase 73B5 [Heracleum sosnowskyi]|uniref:UDP-glycosyltransferase 73B5 n=1 Tax=Heracleum sosnowskyi TaxID=360622 RepID=A0AAD8LV77_9APIA|nr:UDP-glycosyltransferase 73B5 [Heracleum sosnowskyi]